MDCKEILEEQIEVLKAAQQKALEDKCYRSISELATTIRNLVIVMHERISVPVGYKESK